MEKTFMINTPDIIPIMNHELSALQGSELYCCKAKTISGDIVNACTRYDFKKAKWLFPYSVISELIEYYTLKN